MKEKPIIFSSDMVHAILDGRKTQTRRPIKFREPNEDCGWCSGKGFEYIDCGNELSGYDYRSPCRCRWRKCRYDQSGRLWVRETFYKHKHIGMKFSDEYENLLSNSKLEYRKCSAIFMPKYIARITLEIMDVRVERLREITEENAIKEGFKVTDIPGNFVTASYSFLNYWNSLYTKKPEYQWEANPYVWVISFKKVEPKE